MSSVLAYLERKEVLIAIGSLGFAVGIINYFMPVDVPVFSDTASGIGIMASIWVIFGVMLGGILLARRAVTMVYRRQEGVWYYAIAQVIVLFFVLIVAAMQAPKGPWYITIFNEIFAPVAAAAKAMMALWGFAGALKYFRARTLRTFVTLACVFVILFRMTTLGEAVFPQSIPIADWLIENIQGSAYRGLNIAFAIGAAYMGIRFFMGRELRVFGIEEEAEAMPEAG
jgi:hypothetical protein